MNQLSNIYKCILYSDKETIQNQEKIRLEMTSVLNHTFLIKMYAIIKYIKIVFHNDIFLEIYIE